VIILRLLAAILPPYEGTYGQAAPEHPTVDEVTDPVGPGPDTEIAREGSPSIEATDPAGSQES
jgi:hypothetical protein